MEGISIFWHRRDLRRDDNHGLWSALQGEFPVQPLFIFDRNILDRLEDPDDARVHFIHTELTRLQAEYREAGAGLQVEYGFPEEIWTRLLGELPIRAVYANTDYEPYARQRDESIRQLLAQRNIPFHTLKDHVILEAGEVLKNDGTPYTVFTPFSRKWKEVVSLQEDTFKSYDCQHFAGNLFKRNSMPSIPSLEEMGFRPSSLVFPPREVSTGKIRAYADNRDFPAREGTSRLGVHFRFGTISVREKARKASGLSETYLNELIWRDFYSHILAHFPRVVEGPFQEKFNRVEWRDNEEDFRRWCEGNTGYPIVDAGMRELAATGYMHNRVRMITASFLTKHLLIDWRWGEAHFARKLLDFDLASNNGGWQWAAGCGTDAAPYFRIFNPTAQQEKFDPQGAYIRRWVPEWGSARYPKPMVDHAFARNRCLETFKLAFG